MENNIKPGRLQNRYTKMLEKLNLQSLGYYMKEGSNLRQADLTNFIEREQNADIELEHNLLSKLPNEVAGSASEAIENYASIREEIQFSLGMKVGAKLALLLTNNTDTDF